MVKRTTNTLEEIPTDDVSARNAALEAKEAAIEARKAALEAKEAAQSREHEAQEEKMAETTVNVENEDKKTIMAMDEVARKEVINKSNLTRILDIIKYNIREKSQSPMEKVFQRYMTNQKDQYILVLMRNICNNSQLTRLNITQDEIKIQLILSIILLKLYTNANKTKTDTQKSVITENWDRVSTYVDTVIKKDQADSSALIYNKEVDTDLETQIKDSEYEGYFVFLFRYLRYSNDGKYKKYFKLNPPRENTTGTAQQTGR